MAATEFGLNHPLSNSVWAKDLAKEAIAKTWVKRFMGKGQDALLRERTELKKAAGDNITCGLKIQLDGEGIEGDATLEGNEEALQFYDDKIYINQLRHAVRSKGKMSEQRVPYNMRAENRDSLSDWWARRMDVSFFNQICGNTAQTDTKFTGMNTVIAPTTNRIIRQAGRSDDQSLTANDTFDLTLIDVAKERATTANTEDGTGCLIRPFMYQGESLYVMFLHPYQVTAMRTNTSTGQWMDIQKMAGVDGKSNPIFTGALGMYNNVVLHEAQRITTGVHGSTGAAVTTTRRAVLCGAQAATIAFGGDGGSSRFSWKEKDFDYGNSLGVSGGAIWGLKKNKFIPADDSSTNAEDFGTIVVSTYAAAATTA